jgi:hypothetical protein
MSKFFEIVAEVVVGETKGGSPKKKKETYLVDALSVTEAEARFVGDWTKSGDVRDYSVYSVKESRILGIILP